MTGPDPDLDGDLDAALACLRRHAHNPSGYLAVNTGNAFFRRPGLDGLIAYRAHGRFLVQFGGVFADPADRGRLLAGFLDAAHRRRRRVVAVQLMPDDVDDYAAHGFTVNQFGSSYARSLAGFSLAGKPYVRLRNKISRARRAGVTVHELPAGSSSPERPAGLTAALDAVDRRWLDGKGAWVAELDFMIGQRGGAADAGRRLFVARHGETVVGYNTFSPVFGRHPGWLHDLSRRVPDSPPGTGELILHAAAEAFAAEHAGYLHFGFTPFTGIHPDHRVAGGSALGDRFIRFLTDHGEAVYPARSQVLYKHKWQPDLIQPEYVGFDGGISLPAIWNLLRMIRAVAWRSPTRARP